MEIQKIFSNIEDPEENLYSVLMSEEELSLFSELQKEFNSKAQKALRKAWDIKNANKVRGALAPELFEKNKVKIGRVNNPFKSLGGRNVSFGAAGGNTLNSRINTKGLIEEGLTPISKDDSMYRDIVRKRGPIIDEDTLLGGVAAGLNETFNRRELPKYLRENGIKVESLKYLNRSKN